MKKPIPTALLLAAIGLLFVAALDKRERHIVREPPNAAPIAQEAAQAVASSPSAASVSERRALIPAINLVDAGAATPTRRRIAIGKPLEDEEGTDYDTSPEQRVWRAAYVNERRDAEWTQAMRTEVALKAKAVAQGEVKIAGLSCRETICRMYLQFADQLDAAAFIGAPRDRQMQYEFQSLDPTFDGEGFDESDYVYEVLVKRSRPAYLVHRAQEESTDEGTSERDEEFVAAVLEE